MSHSNHPFPLFAAGLFLLALSAVVRADVPDELLAEARQHLEAGEADQAYELLAAQEAEYAGEEQFDYWLGLAAVRAGEHARATFALERVLAVNPDHAGARLELATAYVALDQNEAAAGQLDRLRQLDPPPNAEQRIEELSRAVNRRAQRESRKDQLLWISLETGHDDNVGTWPETELEILPGSPTIEPLDSAFFGVRGGASKNFELNATQKLNLSAQASTRNHTLVTAGQEDAEAFDQDFYMGRGKWISDLDGRHSLEAGLQGGQLRLDGEEYYTLFGGELGLRRKVSDRAEYHLVLNVRDIAFENEINDYLDTELALKVRRQLMPRLRLDARLAAESENAEDRAGGDSRGGSLGADLRYAMAPRHVLSGGLKYTRAEYQDTYEPFQALNTQATDREDNRYRAHLGWDWYPDDDWQLGARVQYWDQDSTLELFDYDRTLGQLSLTRYF